MKYLELIESDAACLSLEELVCELQETYPTMSDIEAFELARISTNQQTYH